MANIRTTKNAFNLSATKPLLVGLVSATLLTGCAKSPVGQALQSSGLLREPDFTGSLGSNWFSGNSPKADDQQTASTGPAKSLVWQKAYQRDPNNYISAANYAKELVKSGQAEQGLAIMEKLHNKYPNDKTVAGEYGRIALLAGDNAKAEKLLSQSFDKRNPDWRILSSQGVLQARGGNHKKAIQYFNRALKLAPKQSSILNNLALAHAVRGNYKVAEKYLKQALWDVRHVAQVKQNLALIYGMQGKTKAAEAISSGKLPTGLNPRDKQSLSEILNKIEGAETRKKAQSPVWQSQRAS